MPKYYVEYDNRHMVIDRPTRHKAARAVVNHYGDEMPENVSVNEQGFKFQDDCEFCFILEDIIPGDELWPKLN